MYDKLITETKAFNVTYMYIDDILSETASSVSFCDIFLKFTPMVTFLPESRNYFNFPHLDSNTCISIAPTYGVYISQIIPLRSNLKQK